MHLNALFAVRCSLKSVPEQFVILEYSAVMTGERLS